MVDDRRLLVSATGLDIALIFVCGLRLSTFKASYRQGKSGRRQVALDFFQTNKPAGDSNP